MNILSQIAQAMQTVLTTIASSTARETGFIKRQRKLSGANFVQTLVFGWMSNPSATLEELTQTAVAQGLDLRFTPEASNFLESILEKAVDTLISAENATVDILQRFNGVYLLDSTVIRLPDSLEEVWQGCQGK